MKLALTTITLLAFPAASNAFVSLSFGATSTKKISSLHLSGKGGMDDYDAQIKSIYPKATATPDGHPIANFKNSPRWRKKTKQLATLGPASSTFDMIEKLFLAGADVFRLNFSHGEHAQKKELLDIIRAVEKKYDHPIAILGDLQGPKIRCGVFANPDGEVLQAGQMFRFDLLDDKGTGTRVKLPHPEIIEASEVGHILLIDDGKVKLEVVGTGPGYLDCKVVVPGKIKDKKVCIFYHFRKRIMCVNFNYFQCAHVPKSLTLIMFSIIITIGSQHSRLHSTNQLLDEEG